MIMKLIIIRSSLISSNIPPGKMENGIIVKTYTTFWVSVWSWVIVAPRESNPKSWPWWTILSVRSLSSAEPNVSHLHSRNEARRKMGGNEVKEKE